MIGNRIHGGTASDVVAVNLAPEDSLVEGNLLVDQPGRMVVNARRHCLIRFNEVQHASKGTWTNAEEVFLIHGGTHPGRRQPAGGGRARTPPPPQRYEDRCAAGLPPRRAKRPCSGTGAAERRYRSAVCIVLSCSSVKTGPSRQT